VILLRNTRHTFTALLVVLGIHPKIAQRILRQLSEAMGNG
jgi:Holliday junction resolvasome RuvABC DNA-binding subunit